MATSFTRAVADVVAALKELEKDIAMHDRRRKNAVLASDISELSSEAVWRAEQSEGFRRLEAAVRNSKASFERFSKQADKDLALLEKTGPSERLNPKHPFLRRKLAALQRAADQIENLGIEMTKTADSINWRIEIQTKEHRRFVDLERAFSNHYTSFNKSSSLERVGASLHSFTKELETRFKSGR